MHPRYRPALALVAAAATVALVAGCGSDDDWSGPHADPTPVGALGAGFVEDAPPPPESTITPQPGSWDEVHPPTGYRVVLLASGDDDDQTQTLVDSVNRWADDEPVSLKTVTNTEPGHILDDIATAIALKPDLVISVGDPLVDPMATVTANHLDQQVLVVGAELAEPTGNVTAADWTGASYRGEGLGTSSTYDASTFTPERVDRAVRAGVAAVLTGHSGLVIWLD